MQRPATFPVSCSRAHTVTRFRASRGAGLRSWCRRGAILMQIGACSFCSLGGYGQPARQPGVEQLAAPAAVIDPEDLGYALGYRIGSRIRADHAALEIPIDNAALARGLADAVQEAAPRVDEARVRRAIAAFDEAMQQRQEAFFKRMAELARVNLAKGRDYLLANARRPGVVSLPSGLQYEVLRAGSGPMPGPDDVVVAHYRGTHIDGREFDGTEPGGEPASFPLRGVVPGWQEALVRMAPGAKWRVHLPPELAYGEEGSPPAIEPNEVLVFEIELLRSEKPQN